jgi:NADP-dependent 3-hydroxy acid dehydrogenase YdfG
VIEYEQLKKRGFSLMYNDYYKDKICLVTGASTGIGFTFSKHLLDLGATVYLSSRTQKTLDNAAELLKDYDKAFFQTVDVTMEEEVKNWIEEAYAKEKRIDFLFNNAGIGVFGASYGYLMEDWKRTIDINLYGVIYGIHHILPIMMNQKSGHIVNVSSIAGLVPIPYQAAYCASKFAVVGIGECLRYEMERHGIYVSTICPGNVETPIFSKIDRPIPDDAISADYAVSWSLERIEQKIGIIPVAEIADYLYDAYHHNEAHADAIIRNIERERFEYALD